MNIFCIMVMFLLYIEGWLLLDRQKCLYAYLYFKKLKQKQTKKTKPKRKFYQTNIKTTDNTHIHTHCLLYKSTSS